jgi:N-acetylneuraminic acid mutarotase
MLRCLWVPACVLLLSSMTPALAQAQDSDGDGITNAADICPNDGLNDVDADGICVGAGFNAPATGDEDNCPFETNSGQQNTDGDDRGDACDQCPNGTGAVEDLCLGTGVWESRADTTFGHSESSLVEVDGLLYLIGGQETSSTEIYNPATNTWTLGPSLPVGNLNHTHAVVVGKKIYIPGGLFGFPGPSTANVMVLDTQNLGAGWSFVAPMPTTRGALGCAADGVKIYCAGGLSSSAGNTAIAAMEVYNTVTDQWTVLTPMPRERDHFQAEIIGGKFYAVSGRDTSIGNAFAFNDIYDIATDTWSLGAPLPTQRGGYASEVLEGRLLVIGGEGGGPSNGSFPHVEEYDPARNTWRRLADLPSPRHGLAAAISTAEDGVTKRMYLITGSQSQGGGNSKINEAFYFGQLVDNDNDGFAPPADCNDNDDQINPGAPELCDTIDNDCDGQVDEGTVGSGGTCNGGPGPGVCAFGTLQCITGSIQCVLNTPSTEICDGLDNDCDGAVDENNPGGGATCSTGQPGGCAAGTIQCTAGSLVCIGNNAQPEICDGLDNDCDASIDEGDPGGGGTCSTGQPGQCSVGTQHCLVGALQCVQNNSPTVEVCDGQDNDCDGSVDENNPGGGGSCATGQPGVCAPGTLQCAAGTLVCSALTPPSAEICDGLDNNCDGTADEGDPGGGNGCNTGLPGACDAGSTQCSNGQLECLQTTTPTAELCDGADNDCDGTTDEGNPEGGDSCNTGQLGACAGGTSICQGGTLACVAGASPVAETCNAVDDDCDGTVDEENPGGGGTCSSGGQGSCANGLLQCVAGLLQCVGDGISPEICDGLDNDCDGSVDEDNPGGGASCGTGLQGACAAGTLTCQSGALGCVADTLASEEVCDSGLDEDCDGDIDELTDCTLCLPENTFELPAQTRKTIIKFPASVDSDKAIAKGSFVMPAPAASDPASEDVLVRIADESGIFYQAMLPAGSLLPATNGRKFSYRDPGLPYELDGVSQAKLGLKSDLRTMKYTIKGQSLSLPGFSGVTSAVTVKIGDACYVDPADSCTTSASGRTVKCR